LGTIKSNAGKIGMYLRDNMGSGHGWGGTNSVFLDCDVHNWIVVMTSSSRRFRLIHVEIESISNGEM